MRSSASPPAQRPASCCSTRPTANAWPPPAAPGATPTNAPPSAPGAPAWAGKPPIPTPKATSLANSPRTGSSTTPAGPPGCCPRTRNCPARCASRNRAASRYGTAPSNAACCALTSSKARCARRVLLQPVSDGGQQLLHGCPKDFELHGRFVLRLSYLSAMRVLMERYAPLSLADCHELQRTDLPCFELAPGLITGKESMSLRSEIPVIDLFAGPGGLCEGFSSLLDDTGVRRFAVTVSVEKDPVAHRTLLLRAILRKFPKGQAPDCYYEYVHGKITREQFFAHPDIRDAAEYAAKEARCAELGLTPNEEIDAWISQALGNETDWVLIGGPPCQAYSLAGRSRLRGKDPKKFETDTRHFLYTEYLRIIQQFAPAVFVMENVKGMLNSKYDGKHIFDRILADLKEPRQDLRYEIRSLVVSKDKPEPNDFVIEADDHGVPQSRHRVILFGIR